MKVDIFIQLDDGGEVMRHGLDWSEACAEICSQHILEQLEGCLSESLRARSMWDYLDDAIDDIIEDTKENIK